MGIFDEALRGVRSTTDSILRSSANDSLLRALDKYRIGSFSLGAILAGGDSRFENIDALNEASFRLSMSLEPRFPSVLFQGAVLPTQSQNYTTARVGGANKYYPDNVTFNDLQLNFVEDSEATVRRTYDRLASLVYEDGFYGIPKDYKQTITCELIRANGSRIISIEHRGCSPVSYSSYTMSTAGQKVLMGTMTFKVEGIVTRNGAGAILTGGGIVDALISGILDSLGNTARNVANRQILRLPGI